MPRKTTFRLSAKEFEALCSKMVRSPYATSGESFDIARQVIVDGVSGIEVAKRFNLSHQYIYLLIARFRRHYERSQDDVVERGIARALQHHLVTDKMRKSVIAALRPLGLFKRA